MPLKAPPRFPTVIASPSTFYSEPGRATKVDEPRPPAAAPDPFATTTRDRKGPTQQTHQYRHRPNRLAPVLRGPRWRSPPVGRHALELPVEMTMMTTAEAAQLEGAALAK